MQETPFTPEPPIYTFRVRILDCLAGYAPENATEIQREIAVAANNTLGDLGYAILGAYHFDNDHLWSFFLSGKAWDQKTEYSYQGSDWGEDDEGLEELLELFPDGSEMRKLALLLDDPTFDPTAMLPSEIDQTKLQAEMVTMLRESIAEAPEAERPLIEEFATLLATDPNAGSEKMSEALERYLSQDWDPDTLSLLDPEAGIVDLSGSADFVLPFMEDEAPDVDDILIREVPYPGKTGKKEFLFIFDYGDEWRFGVKLINVNDQPAAFPEYPRLIAARGEAPPQYPPWDDDDDEAWDEEEEAENGSPQSGVILHFDRQTGQVTRETIAIPPRVKPQPEE